MTRLSIRRRGRRLNPFRPRYPCFPQAESAWRQPDSVTASMCGRKGGRAGNGSNPQRPPPQASGRRRSPRIESVSKRKGERPKKVRLEGARAPAETSRPRLRTAEPESLLEGDAGPAKAGGIAPRPEDGQG